MRIDSPISLEHTAAKSNITKYGMNGMGGSDWADGLAACRLALMASCIPIFSVERIER